MQIRIANSSDSEGICAVYAPIVEKTAISFETEVPTPAALALRIAAAQNEFPWLVCSNQDEIRGYAYAARFRSRPAYRWCAEVSVYVDEQWQRQGVARGLYTALLGILQLQGFTKAIGNIALPNPASVRLHEQFGFQPAGVLHQVGFKLGRWHHVGQWELAMRESPHHPSEPLTVAQVMESVEFQRCLAAGYKCVHPLFTNNNQRSD